MERELINHRSLLHPNIIAFKEVFLTSTHLGIGMEYAAGGELFDRIVKAGRFSEDEARYFFQQLISGVEYCHSEARARPPPSQRPSQCPVLDLCARAQAWSRLPVSLRQGVNCMTWDTWVFPGHCSQCCIRAAGCSHLHNTGVTPEQ